MKKTAIKAVKEAAKIILVYYLKDVEAISKKKTSNYVKMYDKEF